MKPTVYLDYNATAPARPEVIQIMSEAMQSAHNASAVHQSGRAGRKYVEDAREIIGSLVNLPPAQIIFNSGATEGNNTVLRHFAEHYPDEQILVSAIEHPSVLETIPNATHIPVTKDGIIDLDALEQLLQTKTAIVSTMWVNNETGIIQPIKEISDLAHKHGSLLHVDGVQAAGRIETDMPANGIDFMTLSAHKLGGAQGIGALCLGLCGVTPTLLHGGGQEKSARAGTENVAGIAGFGKAAELAKQELLDYQANLNELNTKLRKALAGLNGIKIFGENNERVDNTTLISLPGISSETLLMAFDLEGIAISNGSACSSGKVEPSHVLKAMNESDETASGALRISTGWNTKAEDIEIFIATFEKIYARMKDKISAP